MPIVKMPSASNRRMLEGFAEYRDPVGEPRANHNTVATPPGTRLMRVIRLPHGWRLWLATRDFRYGTYLEVFDDGRIMRATEYEEEGPEYNWVRPSDEEIRNMRGK